MNTALINPSDTGRRIGATTARSTGESAADLCNLSGHVPRRELCVTNIWHDCGPAHTKLLMCGCGARMEIDVKHGFVAGAPHSIELCDDGTCPREAACRKRYALLCGLEEQVGREAA